MYVCVSKKVNDIFLYAIDLASIILSHIPIVTYQISHIISHPTLGYDRQIYRYITDLLVEVPSMDWIPPQPLHMR